MLAFALSYLVLSLTLFVIVRAIYRITLHPLAKVPGPKLAGLSSLYGAYFDFPVTTSYTRQIMKLHDEYGKQ